MRGPGGIRTLGVMQGGSRDTILPGGGRLQGWGHLAVDNLGRVMADLAVEGGPSGLYLWENGAWTATLLRGQSSIRGGLVDGI